jgi:hypothetical protein
MTFTPPSPETPVKGHANLYVGSFPPVIHVLDDPEPVYFVDYAGGPLVDSAGAPLDGSFPDRGYWTPGVIGIKRGEHIYVRYYGLPADQEMITTATILDYY